VTTATSLYQRVGGAPGISDLVVEFYERVLHDPDLEPFFHHTSMDHLHAMQIEFFTLATGGPASRSGFELRASHIGRGVRDHHYRLFVQHLLDTLEARGLEQEDIDAIIDRLALERDEIVDDIGPDGD
jgi:hemoglobin